MNIFTDWQLHTNFKTSQPVIFLLLGVAVSDVTLLEEEDTSGTEPILVSDSDPDPVYVWWIRGLNLYKADCEVLMEGKELTDNLVNAAQALLSTQFSSVGGFQDTILGHHLHFKAVSNHQTLCSDSTHRYDRNRWEVLTN